MPIVLTIKPAKTPEHFVIRVGDVILSRSTRCPFLDGCRRLLQLGHAPGAVAVMRHEGNDIDALRSTIGAAARLTVSEEGNRPPRFKRWKPRNLGEVSAPIAQTRAA